MIQSRYGLALLSGYANDARSALINAFNTYQDTEIFRFSLRVFWMNKAQRFFDGNNPELPYIIYRYTANNPVPHIYGNLDTFINRSTENFDSRNPQTSRYLANKVLSIHASNRPQYVDEFDIFSDYKQNGMSGAAYYFEKQMNQFYRIIFFFLELGIKQKYINEDDIYDGFLPDDVLSKEIQKIVYDDTTFRNYLLNKRLHYESLMGGNTENKIMQHLIRTSCVCEEDLICLDSLDISSMQFVDATTFSYQSEVLIINKTVQYEPQKRKGSTCANKYGKHFNKIAKTFQSDSGCSSFNGKLNENSDTISDFHLQECNNFLMNNSTDTVFDSFSMVNQVQEQWQVEVDNIWFGYIACDDPL